MRLTLFVAACVSLASLAVADPAIAAIKLATDIPAEGLGPALKELARNRGFQVVFRSEIVRNVQTQGAHGDLTTSEALTKLLEGTELSYSYLDDKTVAILTRTDLQSGAASPPDARGPTGDNAGGTRLESQKSGSIRLAQVDQGAGRANSSVADNTAAASAGPQLTEIVVNAEKRGNERLLDTPIPIGVIDADSLSTQGQLKLRDYFSDVPGLMLTPGYDGGQTISVRGIGASGFENPGVGITIDDVPFGSSTGLGSGFLVPDLDPGDLVQVEALRGPQGVLYGTNSMGGLVRYITKDPSTDAFSGYVRAGTSSVYNGGQQGFDTRGAVNIPVSDDFAVRASGFRTQTPGYINDVRLGTRGVNELENDGARVSALWAPSDAVSLKVSALYEDNRSSGLDEITTGPGLSGLVENYIPGSGGSEEKLQLYSAVLNANLLGFNLTSITGFNAVDSVRTLDFSSGFGPLVEGQYGPQVTGSVYGESDHVRKVSEEVRVSRTVLRDLDIQVGGFYTHERTTGPSYANATDIATLQVVDPAYYTSVYQPGVTYQEYAGFVSATYRVTDRFDVQFGGRYTHYSTEVGDSVTGGAYATAFLGANPSISPGYAISDNIGTYLFTPRLRLTDNLMIYARLASGYRPGTANPPDPSIPAASKPDKTRTYELGTKGKLFGGFLTVDASLYYVDWSNIQIQLRDPVTEVPYETNGSGAKSDGVELTLSSSPYEGLKLTGWFSYDDAVLTKAFPANSAAFGLSGDRIPFTPRYSANFSFEQHFALPRNVDGFFGGMLSYVGDRIGSFTDSELRQNYGGYTKLDLDAGVQLQAWELKAYATNATNRGGVLSGGIGYFNPVAFQILTPRTIGLNVSWKF